LKEKDLATPKVHNSHAEQIHKLLEGVSLDSKYLEFSEEEILMEWKDLDPYVYHLGRSFLKIDRYKKEEDDVLEKRCNEGKTNFSMNGRCSPKNPYSLHREFYE
jgi:hypothetical protein